MDDASVGLVALAMVALTIVFGGTSGRAPRQSESAMPIQISDVIAVAAATATAFSLPAPVDTVSVAVVFHTAVSATTANMLAPGTGTRDIAVSRVDRPESVAVTAAKTMAITGATQSAQPQSVWKTVALGTKTAMISVACAAADNATGTHYRIWVAS